MSSQLLEKETGSNFFVGIRAEDYSAWERRVPIVPNDVKEISTRFPNIKFIV